MSLLTKEQIIAAPLPRDVVDVPEWGGKVYVRSVNLAERHRLSGISEKDGATDLDVLAELVATCCIGEDGAPLFTVDEIRARPAQELPIFERLFRRATELSRPT